MANQYKHYTLNGRHSTELLKGGLLQEYDYGTIEFI